MSLTKDQVRELLTQVRDPQLQRDLVTLGAVKKVAVCEGHISVTIGLPGGAEAGSDYENVRGAVVQAITDGAQQAGERLDQVNVEFVDRKGNVVDSGATKQTSKPGAPKKDDTPQSKAQSLPGVKRIIAVGAGKGGVGKSTVSVNLAVALARQGHAVGLMDGDIYGPSVPTLCGLDEYEPVVRGSQIEPFFVHGVKMMTLGKLVEKEKPLIWRGPMAHGAFKQLVDQTNWGELDYLIIDLPPGTGDVPLTMSQNMSLTGAVIVCTPQKVAQDDAVRAARMFEQLGVDVLGIIENMSYFIGDDGKEYDIFGRGGAEQMSQRLGLPYLGGIPIHMDLRENSDKGDPGANFESNEKLAGELVAVAKQLENQVQLAEMRRPQKTPELTIR